MHAINSDFTWTDSSLPLPKLIFATSIPPEETALIQSLGSTVLSISLKDLFEGYSQAGDLARLEKWVGLGGDVNLHEGSELVLMKALNDVGSTFTPAQTTALVKFCIWHGFSSTQHRNCTHSLLSFAYHKDLEELFTFLMQVKMPAYGEAEDVLQTVMCGSEEKYVKLMIDLKGCEWPRPKLTCNALCFSFQSDTETWARYLLQHGVTPAHCTAHTNIFLNYPNITYPLLESGDLINLHKATVYNLIQLYLFRRQEERAVALLSQYSTQLDLVNLESKYMIKGESRAKNRDFRCLSRPLAILAIEAKAEECWKQLVAMGFQLDIQDEHGWTALLAAASFNSLPKVQTLLSLGANKDHRDKTSRTALHQAAQYGYLPIVQALLEAGANTEVTSVDGDFPYDLALDNAHTAVVDYLTSVGADKKRLRQQCCLA